MDVVRRLTVIEEIWRVQSFRERITLIFIIMKLARDSSLIFIENTPPLFLLDDFKVLNSSGFRWLERKSILC